MQTFGPKHTIYPHTWPHLHHLPTRMTEGARSFVVRVCECESQWVGECEPLAFVKLPIKCLEWSKLTLAWQTILWTRCRPSSSCLCSELDSGIKNLLVAWLALSCVRYQSVYVGVCLRLCLRDVCVSVCICQWVTYRRAIYEHSVIRSTVSYENSLA